MQVNERDTALLWDMREATREIVDFTTGVTYENFVMDKVIRYAVERQVMVIGEAANRISPEFVQDHPENPWKGIIGQRNVLAHDYGEILIDRIWLVVTRSIPELLQNLTRLLPPET